MRRKDFLSHLGSSRTKQGHFDLFAPSALGAFLHFNIILSLGKNKNICERLEMTGSWSIKFLNYLPGFYLMSLLCINSHFHPL